MFNLLRPLLFSLDEEVSHDVSIAALACYGRLPGAIRPGSGPGTAGSPLQILGLNFPNRLGLAAGLDKDAQAVEGLARLGFGFVEVGTVTPRPQPGNEKPRLFRLSEQRGIINRMGFNNAGVAAMVERLTAIRRRDRLGDVLLGVNVGKNKTTENEQAVDDYTRCMTAVYPLADYLTLNLSSPNTPGLRKLQSGEDLDRVLDGVSGCRDRLAGEHGRRAPVLVKVAPDLRGEAVADIARAVHEYDIDGVIATNTTLSREGVEGSPHADQMGGLSGAPLTMLAREKVAELRAALGPEMPLIGVGGIVDAQSAEAMFAAGADLIQIYSGFIFSGPPLIQEVLTGGHPGSG